MLANVGYICKENVKTKSRYLSYGISQWTAKIMSSLQQQNSVDCGVFMLHTGRYLVGFKGTIGNFIFRQGYIKFYRYLIGVTLLISEKYAPTGVAASKECILTGKESKNSDNITDKPKGTI